MLYAAGSVRDVSVDADNLCGLTCSEQLLWYADSGRARLVGIDPYTGTTVQVLDCPGLRTGLATVNGNLVYAAEDDSRLRTVDPQSGRLVSEVRNPRPGETCAGMEGARNGLWLGYRDVLELRNVADLSLVTVIGVRGRVSGVSVTDRYLVYCDRLAESVTVVDPVMEQDLLPINVHGSPTGLGWDGSRIWYCDAAASRLRAIDVPGVVRSM